MSSKVHVFKGTSLQRYMSSKVISSKTVHGLVNRFGHKRTFNFVTKYPIILKLLKRYEGGYTVLLMDLDCNRIENTY